MLSINSGSMGSEKINIKSSQPKKKKTEKPVKKKKQ